MRITAAQLAILEMLTWHVRVATDEQIQQTLNDQSFTAHASDILRRLARSGWVFRRKIHVAVPQLSKPLCSWSPNQPKPNLATVAWQLFVRHTNNGLHSSLATWQIPAENAHCRVQQGHHHSLRTSPSPSDQKSGADDEQSRAFAVRTALVENSSPAESVNLSGRRQQMVNWATPKAAHLLAGCSGWGRQPLQIEHDLGTTAMYVSSRPYQSDAIWYGEDIVRRRFSRVNKKVPDVLLVDRSDNILKVMEYGGQYSRQRLEEFHRTWQQYPWEIW